MPDVALQLEYGNDVQKIGSGVLEARDASRGPTVHIFSSSDHYLLFLIDEPNVSVLSPPMTTSRVSTFIYVTRIVTTFVRFDLFPRFVSVRKFWPIIVFNKHLIL